MITADIERLSPNFTPGMPVGKLVVVHATRSGKTMNPTEFTGTLNHFGNPGGVSSHWVVARDGRTARVVLDTNRAAHAGQHNLTAWGIELEQGVEDDGFTAPQIEKLVAIARAYVQDFGVAPVHTLDANASGFIGHQETPQGIAIGKSDPGRKFDWDAFISALRGDGPTPRLGGDGAFTPQNGTANEQFWKARSLAGAAVHDLRRDFSLPAEAKEVEIGLFLDKGIVRVFHGASNLQAEIVGWGATGSSYGRVRVRLDEAGRITYKSGFADVDATPALINTICIWGWRS
jgi:hypothetical protein